MNRTALILSLVVMFLLGCAAGFIGSVVMARSMFGGPPMWGHMAGHAGGPMEPHGGREHQGPPGERFERLRRALDLTPDQVARLQPKVESTRKEFDALRDSMHARIDAELTPAQRAKWIELQKTFPRPGNHDGGWPPPPPGGPGGEEGGHR